MAVFASVTEGEILRFAVFRFWFVLFFANGVRLKLWSFILFFLERAFVWVGFFHPCLVS